MPPYLETRPPPTFSIITVALNCCDVIERTLLSVLEQSVGEVEHILVDGNSSDGTQDMIRKYRRADLNFISEPDRGIYHAMNKGLRLASGDIVGYLNAGDCYADSTVLARIAEAFERGAPEIIFGNVVYLNGPVEERVVRTYDATGFRRRDLMRGIMPPHPATFVKRSLLLKVRGFDEDYRIAGDFDCMIKLIWERQAEFAHIPQVLVKMLQGGISNASLGNRWLVTKEFHRACRKHDVPTSWLRLFSRYPGKIWQSLRHSLSLL